MSANVKFVEIGLGIKAGSGIEAGWGIEAGEGIKAGLGIEAGEGIKAGSGIEAGDFIKAGEDFCIFAGLGVRKSLWEVSAVVTAKDRPASLVSGFWKPLEGRNAQEA